MKPIAQTALILVAAAFGTSAFAQAKAPEPDYTLSFNAGATLEIYIDNLNLTLLDRVLVLDDDDSLLRRHYDAATRTLTYLDEAGMRKAMRQKAAAFWFPCGLSSTAGGVF